MASLLFSSKWGQRRREWGWKDEERGTAASYQDNGRLAGHQSCLFAKEMFSVDPHASASSFQPSMVKDKETALCCTAAGDELSNYCY